MKPLTVKKPGRHADPDHCARRREHILDAAVALFAKHGFEPTTFCVTNSLALVKD